jgi:RNA polymerase sigma-19 factor, ECF subfamily
MNQDHEEGLSPEEFAVLFQSAYNDHGRKLRYYATKFLYDPQDAEDIVATLFARLWAKGPVFNRDKLNWNYLKKAVRNACLDHLDAKGRFERLHSSGEVPSEAGAAIPSHEEDLIRTEVVAQVSELIDRLPPQTRRIILKIYYEDMEPGQAADDMRLALSTIYNSRRNGLGVLLDLLRGRNIRVWFCVTLVFFGNYKN